MIPNPRFTLAVGLILAVSVSQCRSIEKDIAASRGNPETINWPEEYQPDDASFFIHNAIDINASPETVWNILIQAETWPEWYEGASNVKLLNGHKVLAADSAFTWTTMGLDFVSTIKEFEPHARLSWESDKWSIQGYHGWLIIPTDEGCRLITDESQNGLLTYAQLLFQPNKLHRLHDIWLAEIKAKAEAVEREAKASGVRGTTAYVGAN